MHSEQKSSPIARVGLIAGPLIALAVYWSMSSIDTDLGQNVSKTAAIGILMAVWWMTEALPLPATSLLPLVLFPLSGVLDFPQAAQPYANRFIFLFMGGFMIALAIEKCNLHRRIALLTVLAVGTQPRRLIAGFMIATAFLSMWISNTATTALMLPIGLSLVSLLVDRMQQAAETANDSAAEAGNAADFAVCMMLGIAYSASIGGVGTLIGTPPNAFFAGFLAQKGVIVEFGTWLLFAMPLVVVFLFITWLLLVRVVFPVRIRELPGGRAVIRAELKKLGPVSRAEWTVLTVFVSTALAWILRGPATKWPWLLERVPQIANLNDTLIALIAALALFMLPVNARKREFALDWETAKRLPWGMLLLFGGGLSLAVAVSNSGLATWIGGQVTGLSALPAALVVLAVTALIILLTEVTSNLATTSTFLPILYGVAVGIGMDPLLMLAPAALAASCAFMLPVATPPNAIVFGSGHVTIAQMMRAGVWLNVVGILLIPLLTYTLGAWVLGVPVW